MEKRFLQSAIFVLMAGIMFKSADSTSDSESNALLIDFLGGLVMSLVIGTTVYFVMIMTVEITKYLMLFQSVRNWAVGQFDELAGDLDDESEHGKMMREQREQQVKRISFLDRMGLRLKAYLLPDMYANERGQKARAKSQSMSRTQSQSGMPRTKSTSNAKPAKSPKPKSSKKSKKGSTEQAEMPEVYHENPLHVTPTEEGNRKSRGTIQPEFGDIWEEKDDGAFSSGDNALHWSASNKDIRGGKKGKGMRRSLSEGNMMDLESLVFSLAGGGDAGEFQGDNPMRQQSKKLDAPRVKKKKKPPQGSESRLSMKGGHQNAQL